MIRHSPRLQLKRAVTLAKYSTSHSISLVLSITKQLRYYYKHHSSSGLDTEVVGEPHLVPSPIGELGTTLLTGVTQRPGTIDKANVSRETGSEDSMGQRDQPAAPFIIPVLVAVAEPSIESEPGKQTAGYPQRQWGQHPVKGK